MDRRWMLIDDRGNKISQREVEIMSQISVSYASGFAFQVSFQGLSIEIPNHCNPIAETTKAKIWDDICDVKLMPDSYHKWFSNILGKSCRLVFIPNQSKRQSKEYDVGLADGYHSLILSKESVDLLNTKLVDVQVSTRNFRPNLVFTGGTPHIEDDWVGKEIMVGDSKFFGAKICGRCKVITIDPDTSTVNPIITKELVSYRFKTEPSKNIFFGLNIANIGSGGIVRVGDEVIVN